MVTSIKSARSTPQLGRGRRHFYGVPTVQRALYLTPELKERIEREALSRNVRDGVPGKWTFSRTAVDILLDYFEMDKPTQDTGNGR
jgi:hypothetical protein